MRRTASKSFTIPWDFDSPPDLKFDGQCVCCGRPTPDTFPLKVTHATQARIKEASIELPLCARCARDDMRNGLISFGIFFLVGGLAAIALFIFTWARVAELSPVLGIDTRQAGEVSRVAAALTALVGGCAIGLCAELAAKALLTQNGLPCGMLSYGSSPGTYFAKSMDGISESRAGVYPFQDLFQ